MTFVAPWSFVTTALRGNAATSAVSILAGILLFGTAFAAQASQQASEQAWTLTTADFASRRVRLLELNAQGAQLIEPDGQTSQLAGDQLVRLERIGAVAEPDAEGTFVLHLRTGDRLRGRPVKLTDKALVMQTTAFGEVEAPLEQLLALAAPDASSDRAWRAPAPAADEILLANGDQMRGYIAAIEGEAWTFADEQGNETPLNSSAVRQVRFADAGVPVAPVTTGWRVRLADGSLLILESLSHANGQFTLAYRGKTAQLPEAGITWIEPVDGPVRWLADLSMAEAVHTPYLGATFPSIADGAAEAGARGFVVRSRSRLSFEIPAGYARFRTRYAMDGAMTQGSVDVRILLDDKVVHERKALTAADSPEPVEVPLDGAKRLTLEVDYGPGLDVQDVLHWIDPALVKG